MEPKLAKLRRKQLDQRLSSKMNLKSLKRPSHGWIREIRQSLGMTLEDLALRLGVIQQRVSKLEKAEVEGTVTLAKMREAASGLDCEFVYAFVPRGSLEVSLNKQALKAAKFQTQNLSHSMRLENQGVSAAREQELIKEIARELVAKLDRSIWKTK